MRLNPLHRAASGNEERAPRPRSRAVAPPDDAAKTAPTDGAEITVSMARRKRRLAPAQQKSIMQPDKVGAKRKWKVFRDPDRPRDNRPQQEPGRSSISDSQAQRLLANRAVPRQHPASELAERHGTIVAIDVVRRTPLILMFAAVMTDNGMCGYAWLAGASACPCTPPAHIPHASVTSLPNSCWLPVTLHGHGVTRPVVCYTANIEYPAPIHDGGPTAVRYLRFVTDYRALPEVLTWLAHHNRDMHHKRDSPHGIGRIHIISLIRGTLPALFRSLSRTYNDAVGDVLQNGHPTITMSYIRWLRERAGGASNIVAAPQRPRLNTAVAGRHIGAAVDTAAGGTCATGAAIRKATAHRPHTFVTTNIAEGFSILAPSSDVSANVPVAALPRGTAAAGPSASSSSSAQRPRSAPPPTPGTSVLVEIGDYSDEYDSAASLSATEDPAAITPSRSRSPRDGASVTKQHAAPASSRSPSPRDRDRARTTVRSRSRDRRSSSPHAWDRDHDRPRRPSRADERDGSRGGPRHSRSPSPRDWDRDYDEPLRKSMRGRSPAPRDQDRHHNRDGSRTWSSRRRSRSPQDRGSRSRDSRPRPTGRDDRPRRRDRQEVYDGYDGTVLSVRGGYFFIHCEELRQRYGNIYARSSEFTDPTDPAARPERGAWVTFDFVWSRYESDRGTTTDYAINVRPAKGGRSATASPSGPPRTPTPDGRPPSSSWNTQLQPVHDAWPRATPAQQRRTPTEPATTPTRGRSSEDVAPPTRQATSPSLSPRLSPPPVTPTSPTSSTTSDPPAVDPYDIIVCRVQETVFDVKRYMPAWHPPANLNKLAAVSAVMRPGPHAPRGSMIIVELLKGAAYSTDLLDEYGPTPLLRTVPPVTKSAIPLHRLLGTRGIHIRPENPSKSGRIILLVTGRPTGGANSNDLVAGPRGISSLLTDDDEGKRLMRRHAFLKTARTAIATATKARARRKTGAEGRVQGFVSDIKLYPMSEEIQDLLAPSDGRSGIAPHAEVFLRAFPLAFSAVAFLTVTPLRQHDGSYIEHNITDPMKGGFFRIGRQHGPEGWQADVADAFLRCGATQAFSNHGSGTLPGLLNVAEWAAPSRPILSCRTFCHDAGDCRFTGPTIESLRDHWSRRQARATIEDPHVHGPSVLTVTECRAFYSTSHAQHTRVLQWFTAYVANLGLGAPLIPHVARCDICMVHAAAADDASLLRCSMCQITVHGVCYFTSAHMAATTEWRCRKCTPTRRRQEGMPPPQCLLCPARTGPLCPTTDGNWTHVTCATRVDNVAVSFATGKRVDPTIDISGIRSSLDAKRCTVCRIKTGACITCSHGGCPKVFHVTCALHQGFRHVYRAAGDTACEDVKPRVFCRLHS